MTGVTPNTCKVTNVESTDPYSTLNASATEENMDPVICQILRALFLIGGLIGAVVAAAMIEACGGSEVIARNTSVTIAATTTLIYMLVLSPRTEHRA